MADAYTPEQRREYGKKWYREHKDYVIKRSTKWRLSNPRRTLVNTAKARARKSGIPFDISEEDIVIPDVCPVLGIPLTPGVGQAGPGSPSIDRLVPSRGYVKGNVAVISHRANNIKSSATIQEVELLLEWMKNNVPA